MKRVLGVGEKGKPKLEAQERHRTRQKFTLEIYRFIFI
jgi:hypothetical protein